MHPIFQITSSDIQDLNDEQARELIARLCKAELQSRGIGTESVTWGGDQRAKDGGVDVRVDMAQAIGLFGYIPRDATAYQVKAENFGPSKIPGEMAPKGILRPAITEFSDKSGAYVIVSTKDNLSDSSLISRRKAMLTCLEKSGLAKLVHTDFYDSRKIADWVENFPGIVIWLRNTLGRPIEGWKPYGPWAYREKSVQNEYLLDEKVKIFIPNVDEGIVVTAAIDRLRMELSKNGASVRIVGLSGVGKTRLVQALFDDRIVTSSAVLNQNSVIYTDLSDNPTPQPIAMLEALSLEAPDCIVIVDNCGQDVHQKLTEIVKRPNTKIRLVTIEYDIRDDLPQDTACYRLEGSSDEIISKLLKRHFENLSDLDIGKIIKFSDGNARVAFALASTSQGKGELVRLTDDALFRRLFIQKHSTSDELQKTAEVASLLYSFDVEDISEESELALLSSIAELTIPTFYRNVVQLEGRGLIQKRGKWRAVLPHAISNRLALKAIQSNHPNLLVTKLVTEASKRVAQSFSRRLGYLHESQHAKKIVGEWLKPEGILGDATQLDELQRQMLENVAPVNQHAALEVCLRAVDKPGFTSLSNRNRADFTRLLRSLAYEPELFEDAAEALLKFSLQEPEDYKSDPSRDILKSLFFSHLSGTLASPEQRATFVRTLILSGDTTKQTLALSLLSAGLETHHFYSSYGFDFGALKRTYGWHPRTLEDFRNWYGSFIHLAVELGKMEAPIGLHARGLLGTALRGLWGDESINGILIIAAHEFASIDGWPEGWIGIRNTLHWEKKHLKEASLEQLKVLEKELAPSDLLAKIQAKILTRSAFGTVLDDEFDTEDAEPELTVNDHAKPLREAEILGKEAALDDKALADLSPYVFNNGYTNKTFFFGLGIGQEFAGVHKLFDRIKELIAKAPDKIIDFQFVTGLIEGWNKSRPEEATVFLNSAIEDEIWGPHFPHLQLSVQLNEVGFKRIVRSLELGQAPSGKYNLLGYGRRTDILSVEQISTLLDLLLNKPDGGQATAIDVLHMVVFCAHEKDDSYRKKLQSYCAQFVGSLDWGALDLYNENFMSHLVRIIEFSLSGSNAGEVAKNSLHRIMLLAQAGKDVSIHRLSKVLEPFFKKCPIETLDAVYIKEELASQVRNLTTFMNRHGETALGVIPEAELIDWCKVSPEDRCIFAAHGCKLFERLKPYELDDQVLSISSTAQAILALAPEKKQILEIFVRRFSPNSWSGSRAAIMRQRYQLLDQLNPTDNVELRPLIEDAKTSLLLAIETEEQWEQERERSETGSFE